MRRRVFLFLAAALVAAGPGKTTRAATPPVPPPYEVKDIGGLRAEAAALLMSGQEGGELRFAVTPFAVPDEEGASAVWLLFEIPGSELAGAGDRLHVELYAYALAEASGVAGSLTQVVAVRLSPALLEGGIGGLRFLGRMRLPPGAYSLRAMGRIAESGRLGLRMIPLEVRPAGEETRVLPPLFAAPGEDWLEIRAADREGGAQRSALFPTAGWPTAVPVLDIREPLEAEVLVEGLEAEPDRLDLEIVDSEGRLTDSVAAEEVWMSASGIPGMSWLRGRFPPLATGCAGCRLRLRLHSEGGPERVSPPALARAVADGDEGPGSASVPPGLEPVRERGIEAFEEERLVGMLQGVLEEALSKVAAGEDASARALLRQVDEVLLGGVEAAGEVPALAVAENRLIEAVGDREPQGLTLVALTHLDLYRYYRSRRSFSLAAHHQKMAFRVIEVFRERSSRVEALQQTADLLVCLGAELQESFLPVASRRAFFKALEVDPDHSEALLGLAVSFERYAEYEAAREQLERLVRAQPADEEGRLRLAVNLQRLGESKKAMRHLDELASGAKAVWVRAVAAQERVRSLLEAEEWKEAEAVLQEALLQNPGDEKLHLQAAMVDVAQGQPWRAHDTLDRLASRSAAGDRAVEPRYRYAHWPSERLAAARARVESTTKEARKALAEALRDLPAEGAR